MTLLCEWLQISLALMRILTFALVFLPCGDEELRVSAYLLIRVSVYLLIG